MNRKLLLLCLILVIGELVLIVLYSYSYIFCSSARCSINSDFASGGKFFATAGAGSVENIYSEEKLARILNTGNRGQNQLKWELEFVLRLRKLMLWSIREVNLKLRGHECARWWANPLSVLQLKESRISSTLTRYTLTFQIQPGRIHFQTVVDVQKSMEKRDDALYEPEALTFILGRRLDVLPPHCGTVPQSLRDLCLCPQEKVGAENKTMAIRKEWKVNDPEFSPLPPDSSFMVPDFLTFGSMDIYLKSPVNNRVCDPKVRMIIFVSSAPGNLGGRLAIRETYGNRTFLEQQGVVLFFVFDKISNELLQDKIDNEFDQFDDIIQAGHYHSYYNLTLRDLSMFNWLVSQCRLQNCSMPKWIMKTDDDYFINVPLALEVTEVNSEVHFMGSLNCRGPVIRDSYLKISWKKYYTPRYIHIAGFYPGYLSGATWLIRSDVLPLLLKASLTTPFTTMDDVYVSGMLTREVGIQPRGLAGMTYERNTGICTTKQMINSRSLDAADFHVHWKYFCEEISKNCEIKNHTVLPLSSSTKASCFFA